MPLTRHYLCLVFVGFGLAFAAPAAPTPGPCVKPARADAKTARRENGAGVNAYRRWRKHPEAPILKQAFDHFTRSVALDCTYVRARLNLAGVEMRKNQFAPALENLEVALSGDRAMTLKVVQFDDDFTKLVLTEPFKKSAVGQAYFAHLEKNGVLEFVQMFRAFSKQEQPDKVSALALRLGQFGARGTASLAAVIARDPDRRLIMDTAQVFVRGRGVDALDEVQALLAVDRPVSLRLLGLVTLRRYLVEIPSSGKKIAAAVPALVQMLRSPSPDLRSMSCVTLSDLGGLAKESIPPLTLLLQDRVPTIRGCASFALQKIANAPNP